MRVTVKRDYLSDPDRPGFMLVKRPFLVRLRNHYRVYRVLFPPWQAFRAAWKTARS